MLSKPNYCNYCGEEIDRIEWKVWTSRHYCENCEGIFRKEEWLPRVGVVGAIIFGLFGFGSYLKAPEKPLTVTNNEVIASVANKVQTPNSNISKSNSQVNVSNLPTPNLPNAKNPTKETAPVLTKPVPKENLQNLAEEPVYFCGAQTKKGNPCTRKVKGTGRCWQHTGQPAMLPKEKLTANS